MARYFIERDNKLILSTICRSTKNTAPHMLAHSEIWQTNSKKQEKRFAGNLKSESSNQADTAQFPTTPPRLSKKSGIDPKKRDLRAAEDLDPLSRDQSQFGNKFRNQAVKKTASVIAHSTPTPAQPSPMP
ncbi:hypothetical protein [Lentzea flaviverrucosa]|uniref:hypothetical protein n=1 Tax=Lentzea flaviverrucosa TaxID=200379 RepID=UPI00116092AB|nr:hypothetical protein [Lentzea flaviverrucosa]